MLNENIPQKNSASADILYEVEIELVTSQTPYCDQQDFWWRLQDNIKNIKRVLIGLVDVDMVSVKCLVGAFVMQKQV